MVNDMDSILSLHYGETPDTYEAFLKDLVAGSLSGFDLTTEEHYLHADALGIFDPSATPKGPFNDALASVEENDPLVSAYLRDRRMMNRISPSIIAQGLLNHRARRSEYFMKRILLVELLQ